MKVGDGDSRPGKQMPGLRWCFLSLTIIGVTGCAVPDPDLSLVGDTREGSLLGEVREITQEKSLPEAKQYLVERLTALDESGGDLERRAIRTTREPGLILPDSLAAMPLSQRRRTALAIIPGTRTGNKSGKDRTRDCLKGAAEESKAMGFSTYFIETEARGTIEQNAGLVSSKLQRAFDQSDAVILLMLSKGAHDVIWYLQNGGMDLSVSNRNKLVAVISLAGTVQGSVVADWLVSSPRLIPSAMRGWLQLSDQEEAVDMLESIAVTPWSEENGAKMAARYPRLTWISIAMVPDGPDGRITERLWSPLIRRRVEKCAPYYSPSDGLVETAASVVPEWIGLHQWIVAAYGSHSMPNGSYRDGSRIAPETTVPGKEKLKPETGAEVISAYLRALPRSLLH